MQEERKAAAVQRGDKPSDEPGIAEAPPAPEPDKPGETDKGKGRRRRNGEEPEIPFKSDNWFFTTVRAVHYVLPRAKDLDHLMSQLLIRDLLTANQVESQKIDKTRISWGESLTVNGVFIGLMLGLACLRFATKDY